MASDIGTGTTIVGGTGSATQSAAWEVLSIDFNDVWSREDIDFSHMETTGGKDFKPSDLYDPGTLVVTVQFDDTITLVPTPAIEAWTVTFPGGATFICNGYIKSWGKGVPLEDKMTQTITIKLTGDITGTLLS